MDAEDKNNLSPGLQQYLELCTRIYERMENENSWPWLSKEKK
jgi:hypothetical protein